MTTGQINPDLYRYAFELITYSDEGRVIASVIRRDRTIDEIEDESRELLKSLPDGCTCAHKVIR